MEQEVEVIRNTLNGDVNEIEGKMKALIAEGNSINLTSLDLKGLNEIIGDIKTTEKASIGSLNDSKQLMEKFGIDFSDFDTYLDKDIFQNNDTLDISQKNSSELSQPYSNDKLYKEDNSLPMEDNAKTNSNEDKLVAKEKVDEETRPAFKR